jgi:ribosomal protein S18 acetylase RimI-like enzyme
MLELFKKPDISRCVRLFIDVFSDEPFKFGWLTEEGTSRYFRDITHTPGFLGFKYTDGSGIIGFCLGCVSDYYGTAQYDIKEIAVDTQKQRQGIGSIMLNEIESYLIKSNISSITLMTDITIPAYGFYTRRNYQQSKRNVQMFKILEQ